MQARDKYEDLDVGRMITFIIKLDFKETVCVGLDWIKVAQGRV
jgi:hypothetical protein